VLLGEGIIEKNTDFDLFSFTAASGPTRIFIDPPANSPNIDIKAELLDASLSVVATSDVTDQLAATFDATLTAGSTYFVRVTGAGNRTWTTGGYDDYGSLGTYAVQVGGFGTVASYVPSAGQAYDPITGTSLFSDVTLGSLTRTGVGGGTNGAATWPLYWDGAATQDLGEYISFTATPDAGRLLDVSELAINFGYVGATGTIAVRSSVDGFAANIDGTRTVTSGTGTTTFDLSPIAESSSTVEFRVYLWSGGAGWRDLNSLSLEGRTISDAPPPATAPVANNDAASTNAGQAIIIDVLTNDTDGDGDTLTVSSIATQPASGTVTINANHTMTYTPNSGFTGSDSFTYFATDGALNSNAATVSITVNALPPTGDSVTTSFQQDIGGYTSTVDTWIGSSSPDADNSADYLHLDESGGVDIEQSLLRFDDIFGIGPGQIPVDSTITSATLTLYVSNPGSAPKMHRILTPWADTDTWNSFGSGIQNDGVEAAVNADATFTHASTWYTMNSVDVTNSLQAWLADPSSNHGWVFLPTSSDGLVLGSSEHSNVARHPALSVTYTTSGANHAPVAVDDVRATNVNEAVILRPARNDFDTDGDALTSIVVQTQPAHGTLTANGDGSLTYTPTTGYVGSDSFTYSVSDGSLSSDPATFDLSVLALPTILPTPTNPFIPANDPVGEQQLLDEIAVRESTIAELVTAHPTAAEVYGAIPANTPRVTQTVTIDTIANASRTLHPTGLYAAPGELIYVTVPPELVAQDVQVHISTWTDGISGRSEWLRVPDGVQREFDINNTLTYAAGAFGGLIYIETPSNPPVGSFDVTIENAIEAPYFVLGETTDAEWIATIRDNPAPWSVLRGGNIDIHLPSDQVRNLDNPTALMTFWKAVVDAQDDLSGVAETRTRPEGMAIDVQISVGALHSGYPTKAPYSSAPILVDLATLEVEGAWGWFHELGHEHQESPWNISGDGEVSVNFFTLYAYDTLGLQSDRLTQTHRVSKASSLLDASNTYPSGDAWQKLAFYQQIQAGFGWDAFKTFFRSYHDGSPEDLNATFGLPATNQDEIDNWLLRMSTIVNRDLTPHFDAWGYGVTQAARDAVAHLPDWSMIENLSPSESVVSIDGAATSLDLNDNVWGAPLNGAITFTPAGSLTNGTLTNHNDGTFTYTPDAGFLGSESLSFNVTNTQGGATSINVTFSSAAQSIANNPVDTRIGEDFPDADHSATTTLYVDGLNSSFPAATLLRFDSLFGGAANQIPVGATIVSAELELNFTDPGSSFTFHRMLQSWSDSDTFNSLTSGVSTNDIEAAATADLTTGSNATGLKTFDVTTAVAAWSAAPATNFGWLLNPGTSSNGNDIASAESATPPKLTINWLPGDAPTNHAPVGNADSAIVNEDGSVTIAVLANDTDPNGDVLSVAQVSSLPANGSVVINANNTITYTPNANYHGIDSFSYVVSDGSLTDTATVSLTVTLVNDAPVAANDSASTAENTAVTISVLTNDADIDGDSLTPAVVTQPANGTATVNGDGTITYTPNVGFSGTDSFTYVASDGTLNSNTATVTLTVAEVIDVLAHFDPTGSQGSADLTGTTTIGGVTVGDLTRVGASYGTNTNLWPIFWSGNSTIDPSQYLSFTVSTAASDFGDFSSLTVSFYEWVSGTSDVAVRTSLDGFTTNVGGVQTLADSGVADVSFDLTSLPLAAGTTEFRIYLFDSIDGTAGWRDLRSSASSNGSGVLLEGSTVSNTAPVAGNDSATTNEDTAVTINILSNDSDADGQSFSPTILTQPANGTATLNGDGTVTYTPDANFNGSDSFTYRVSDGSLNSNTATVSISVTSVNDAPTAIDDFFATDFESVLNIAPDSVLDNDSDIDGDTLTVSSHTQPLNGSVTVNSDGTFTYTPDTGFSGNDGFTYSVSDGTTTSMAVVTITVNGPTDDHGNSPDATATAITLNGGSTGSGSASGTLEVAGDRDVFAVTVGDGTLAIDLDGINGLDTYLRVYNASGTQIASDDDGGPGYSSALSIEVTAGTYYLSAGSYADSYTGDFTLSVTHTQSAQTQSATFQQGVDGYTSISDTFLTGDYPAFSYGGWTVNEIDLSSGSGHEHSLLQFGDVFGTAAGQIPAGSQIVSATLTFYVSNPGDQFTLHRMLQSWSDTATWNDFGSGIQADNVEALATPDVTTSSYVSTGWLDLDVTSSVQEWSYDPASNHGWAMLPTGTNGINWYSANNVSYWVPRLAVEYTTGADFHSDTPDASATPLDLTTGSATVIGTFETAGDRDVFAVTFTETVTLTIDLGWTGAGSFVDTYLRLYDATGAQIASNDDGGSGTSSYNSRLTITLGPGIYFISAGSYADDDAGDFELSLSIQ
jgi:large repetitive protein